MILKQDKSWNKWRQWRDEWIDTSPAWSDEKKEGPTRKRGRSNM